MVLQQWSNEASGPFPQKSAGRRVFERDSFVVAAVMARYGDTPVTPPRCQPKSLAAAPHAFLKTRPQSLGSKNRPGGNQPPDLRNVGLRLVQNWVRLYTF